jgi:membrane protease subunit HflC
MRNLVIIGGLIIFGIIMFSCSVYTVDQTEQAILTRFGEVQGEVKTAPGLYFKAPFNIDKVATYDKRLLRIDAPPQDMLDKNLLLLDIDVYARYRIIEAVQFRKTLSNEENARRVLGQKVNAALRAEVAQLERPQIIGGDVETDEEGLAITDEEGNSRVTATESRTDMLGRVLAAVREDLADEPESFGVEMVDVRIKRADFPAAVSGRVFARMESEREKIARRLRAEGEERSRTIRAEANRDVEVILAQADQRSNQLRGQGEAKAIAILAEALGADPEFFAFRRSLNAYREFFDQGTTVILSADADLFKFLDSPGSGSERASPEESMSQGEEMSLEDSMSQGMSQGEGTSSEESMSQGEGTSSEESMSQGEGTSSEDSMSQGEETSLEESMSQGEEALPETSEETS